MNLRKDNHGRALAAWKALGPAKVCHPLRYIRAKDTEYSVDAKGVRHAHQGPFIQMAEISASHGHGMYVQHIAMGLASEGAIYRHRG